MAHDPQKRRKWARKSQKL